MKIKYTETRSIEGRKKGESRSVAFLYNVISQGVPLRKARKFFCYLWASDFILGSISRQQFSSWILRGVRKNILVWKIFCKSICEVFFKFLFFPHGVSTSKLREYVSVYTFRMHNKPCFYTLYWFTAYKHLNSIYVHF